MQIYNLITVIIVITAVFGYINFRFIKLPATIGIMLISLIVSLLVIATGYIHPGIFIKITDVIKTIDFNTALMKVMLAFLLFAGAIHIDIKKLKRESAAIITFSTLGVIISTFVVAVLMFAITKWFGMPIGFIYCLLFGALISPTDPIAVLGILKRAKIPSTLEIKISGESLFNDGVGVVVFITIYEIIKVGYENVSALQIIWLFLREAGGGLLFGLLLGYIGFWMLRSIENYIIEVLITLAIVMGGYALADYLHISGPLAMVVAGIVTGNKILEEEVSDITRDYIDKFWEMIDEVMNAILFLLIGFEMLIIPFSQTLFWLGCVTILIVLLARFISVIIPISFLKFSKTFERNAIPILVWGGLRGGISVALALSLPKNSYSEVFVSITYMVVLFSIIVQGLTIGKFAQKLAKNKK
ncbi:MAG: sodium:proton antiporter [Chitinophagaceae bacterium]|nr:sodium:proton antiporter [Chitinophagaceae bacterium]